MLTLFLLLAAAGGVLRLALQWGVQRRWGITIGVPQALAGAVVVLAGLPEFLRPFPFRGTPRRHHRSAPTRPSGAEGLRCGFWK